MKPSKTKARRTAAKAPLNAKSKQTTDTDERHVAELHKTANSALICRAVAELGDAQVG